jgi:hypothetical protein
MMHLILAEMDARRALIETGLGEPVLFTFEKLRELVAAGEVQVWFGDRSVMMSELQTYHAAKVLQCFMAAGDIDEIEQTMRPAMEAWGREQGCDYATVEASRRGWERALKPHGYGLWSVKLVKAL